MKINGSPTANIQSITAQSASRPKQIAPQESETSETKDMSQIKSSLPQVSGEEASKMLKEIYTTYNTRHGFQDNVFAMVKPKEVQTKGFFRKLLHLPPKTVVRDSVIGVVEAFKSLENNEPVTLVPFKWNTQLHGSGGMYAGSSNYMTRRETASTDINSFQDLKLFYDTEFKGNPLG